MRNRYVPVVVFQAFYVMSVYIFWAYIDRWCFVDGVIIILEGVNVK